MKPYNNTNNTENMNQVNNPQTVTDKGDRQCYAFILYVGGEISRVLTCGWWSSYNDAERTADGMAVAAVAFKKTAAVVAYALQDNDVYELMITRNVGSRDRVLYKIHRSRLESGKYIAPTKEEQTEYFNQKDHDRYSGAECMPVGWMDAQTAQNENATVIEPVRNHRISTDADEIKSDVLLTAGDQNRPKPWAVDMTPKEFWHLQSDWDADELPEEDAEFIGHYFHADFGVAGAMTVFVHGYAGNEAHAMVTVYHVDGLSHDEESFVQNVLPIATFFHLLTPERGWQRMTAQEIEERRASL